MNTPIRTNEYFVEIRKPNINGKVNGKSAFMTRFIITAKVRKDAVTTALNWFWSQSYRQLGQAIEMLTVSDPRKEVHYGPNFNCSLRENRYLDANTVTRLLGEATSELVPDTGLSAWHHPKGSVKRRKRRRDILKRIGLCIYNTRFGTMYFRTTTISQLSRGGRRLRKRKVTNIRLTAQNMSDALREIRQRNLFGNLTFRRRHPHHLELKKHCRMISLHEPL